MQKHGLSLGCAVLPRFRCLQPLRAFSRAAAAPRLGRSLMEVQSKLNLSLDDIIIRSKRPGGARRGFAARAFDDDDEAPPMRERSRSPPPGGREPDGRRVFVGNLSYTTSWQTLKDHFKTIGNVVYADIKREGSGPGARSKGCGIVEFESPQEASQAIQQLGESELEGRHIMVREDRGAGPANRDSGRGFDGGSQRRTRFSENAQDGGGGWYGDAPDGAIGGRRQAALRGDREGGYGGRREGGYGDREGGYGGWGRGDRRGDRVSSGLQIVVHGLPFDFQWQDLKDMVNEKSGGAVRANVMTDRETGRPRGSGTVRFETEEAALAAIEALQGIELDGRFITAKLDAFA